jgi:hypothetical protein
MKIIGIALVALGIVALLYGGINYNRQRTVLQIGDMKATATEHKTFPISPIFGALSLVAGVAILVLPKRKLLPV